MNRVAVTALGGICCIGMLVGPAWAQEATAPVRLVYESGENSQNCPGLETFRAEVVRRVGADPFTNDAALEVRVRIENHNDGFLASVELTLEGALVGSRSLTSESCATVVRAAGLAVVLMLPTSEVVPAPAPEPETPARAAPLASPTPALSNEVQLSAASSRGAKPTTTEVVAKFGGAVGMLPTMSESVGFGTRVHWQDWSLDAEAAWHRSAPAPMAGGEVLVTLWTASAGPCRHFGDVGVCGIASAGVMLSEGRNLGTGMQASTPYGAIGTRATWDYHVSERIAIRSSLDLSGTLLRARLRVTGTPMGQWDAPVAATAIGMSISGRLW